MTSAERSSSGRSNPPRIKPYGKCSRRMGYADCVPNPRTDQSALENSIRAVYGTRNKTIVSRKQPKRNGVELVNIERSTQRNGYVTNFGAKVLGSRVKADYGFADEGP